MNNIEIIEHKGFGHPDTICDTVVEKCATYLDNYYMTTYGKILHYNVDKALFLAGNIKLSYGSYEVLKNPHFILGGQVSNLDDKLRIGLYNCIKYAINEILPNLCNDFTIEIMCNNVSQNLNDIANGDNEIIYANDTSFGVAHYPPTIYEDIVLKMASKMKELITDMVLPIGEDFKIMKSVDMIYISVPVYYNAVSNFTEYKRVLEELQDYMKEFYKNVKVNPDSDNGFVYLTRCGSSIECGDDGQVGRGNRLNGLITPMKPMTMEAYSGKNNKNHTGKLYQKLALDLAKKIYKDTNKPVEVTLISKIGKDIYDYDSVINYI